MAVYILGINGRPVSVVSRKRGHGGNHNAAACILKNGKLLAFVEEERFTHIKHDGSFPIQSINYCLKIAGIALKDVDYIAYGWLSYKDTFFARLSHFLKTGMFFKTPTFCAGITYYSLHDWLAGDIQGAFKKNFPAVKLKKEQFMFIEHHLAHAASAFRASGFENAAILTLDGAGETASTMLASGNGNTITVNEEFHLPDSLGFCYSSYTEYLGFIKNNDEYKVMGLASYAKPTKKINDILTVKKDGTYSVSTKYLYHFSVLKRKYNYKYMIERYGPERLDDNQPIDQRHKEIAATIQYQLEQAGIGLAKRAMKRTQQKNLCLAGGVALNCKMNKAIREATNCEMFVQPAAADMGVALGAALEAWARLGHTSKFKMEHVYYGPEYSNAEIERALKKNKLKYHRSKNISVDAAEHIYNNEVVGWYQGRMEAGPRALGNRSILANPCTKGMDDLVNEKIKFREKWRPFCPSLIDEAKEKYFERSCETPFMILTFDVKKEMRKHVPAIVHIDGTARPQTVKQHVNPRYYALIKHFGSLSGHPIVLNTSFNIKGDTIVDTPQDAIRTFLITDMDVLAIGDFVVLKEQNSLAVEQWNKKHLQNETKTI